MTDIAQELCVETGESHWQSVGNRIIFVLMYPRMFKLPWKIGLPSVVNQATSCLCNAINVIANMSTLINIPVLCASISLAKRLKSGKTTAEIEEWNCETNGSLVVVPFGTWEKMVPIWDRFSCTSAFPSLTELQIWFNSLEEAAVYVGVVIWTVISNFTCPDILWLAKWRDGSVLPTSNTDRTQICRSYPSILRAVICAVRGKLYLEFWKLFLIRKLRKSTFK